MRVVPAFVAACIVLLAAPRQVCAQTADNLLVVINGNSAASVLIGEYYAKIRQVAPDHILRVYPPVAETITRANFERTLVTPLLAALARASLQDRVLYFVLTKDIPLRIAGTGGRDGTTASVDSELTLLYRRELGASPPILGWVQNPYFLGTKPPSEAKRFTRFASDLYLVTRLDGFTLGDVIGLIDRSAAVTPTGWIVLDEKATLVDHGGDQWLQEAAARLKQTPVASRVVLETTHGVASAPEPVIGYYSWGSNDPAHARRQTGLKFSPGAIGAMFVSTDGRTFAEPPPTWKPSGPDGGPAFGGSFQSLAGDLIREGLTGVAAHVNEPFLDATIRPQILFPAYVAGFNLAEAFYLAMPYLSWQTIVIGDPLCAPFSQTPLRQEELDKGLDAETGLPALFAERRLAIAASSGLNPGAVKILLKLESEVAKGDQSNAETLLVRATELEPRLLGAQTQLAELYASRQEYEKSIDRYRRIVAVDDKNQIAMNNLAFYLAEFGHRPQEALPIAQRAYRLSPEPTISDTVGWVHHLLGDDNAAVPFINFAVSQLPQNADVLIHAATVHAAVHETGRARAELETAEKLTLSDRQKAAAEALRLKLERP